MTTETDRLLLDIGDSLKIIIGQLGFLIGILVVLVWVLA